MKGRRTLAEGLSQEEREKAFVYDNTAESPTPAEQETVEEQPPASPAAEQNPAQNRILPQYAGRVPVTARMRPEVASAVKRASLTRQLDGVHPHTVQDIVEEALESWLRTHGYLNN